METLFIFLVKASGLIGMFYLAYLILLRKETFFNSNRWFLLAGLITSALLPLVVFTKIVWVDPDPNAFDWSNIPVTTTTVENEGFEINWYLVFGLVYSIGILGFLTKFAFDFYSLSKVLKDKTIQHQADFQFIDVSENIAPFSYFNSIVYNSSLYSATELENILEHEKVHSEQNHTADVLISRLFCIIFWFNPLMWLYKKAIVQNLEFIADSEALKKLSDKKAYQLTLLKITTQENCVAITNHFYQSLIKKRIVMLNKNQSKKWNSWKYAAVLPLLGAFLFFFQVKVVAQEKTSNTEEIVNDKNYNFNFTITKNTTDEEIKEQCEQIKKTHNIDLTFSTLKRNTKGEIINIESKYKDNKGGSGTWTQTDNTPIEPFRFFANEKETGYTTLDVASLSKGKEIYVDGEISSQEELDKLDPNEIKSVNVINKETDKPTLLITTKNISKSTKITSITNGKSTNSSIPDDTKIFINGGKSSKSEMDKLDPKEIESIDVLKEKKEIRIFTKKWLKSSEEFTFYIDDKKVTPQEFYLFNPEMIESSNGNLDEKTLRIVTKNGITIVKVETSQDKVVDGWKVSAVPAKEEKTQDKEVNGWKISSAPIKDGIKQDVANQNNVDYKKVVVIIDGKISNERKLNKLNPKEIVSIKVQKFSDASQKIKDEKVKQYGEKALNGIVEVETKKL